MSHKPTVAKALAYSTNDAGETPAAAALGETPYDITPLRPEIQHRHFFHWSLLEWR